MTVSPVFMSKIALIEKIFPLKWSILMVLHFGRLEK